MLRLKRKARMAFAQGGLPDAGGFRSIGNVNPSEHCTLAYASTQLAGWLRLDDRLGRIVQNRTQWQLDQFEFGEYRLEFPAGQSSGAEGFVGLPLLAGLKTSASRVIAQVAGTAFRISAANMTAALSESPVLRRSLNQFGQDVAVQSSQIAACNRLHHANQRLARWLLMSQDRLGGNQIRLTQEFLAHMLGMRRASVNIALGFLQKKRFISFGRGAVIIQDRSGLESAACECYASIIRHQKRWRKESR